MAELRLCPFCGNEPTTTVKVIRGTAKDGIIIEVGCYKCDVWKSSLIESGENVEKFYEATATAIAYWNRRFDDDRKTD